MARMLILSKLTWASVLRFVLGYLVGCVVAGFVMAILHVFFEGNRHGGPIVAVIIQSAVMMGGLTAIFSMPTYLLFRAIMYWLQFTKLQSFTIFGALNGASWSCLFSFGGPSPTEETIQLFIIFPIAGAFAGAAIWFFERWYSGKTETKVQAT